MNKLIITQDTSRTEQSVPNSVIVTLYNIGKDDDLNQSFTEGVDTTNNARPVSTVSGSIRVSAAYSNQLEYIATKYPNLNITVDSEYIYFEDPEVERVLIAAGIGDGIGIPIVDAATANLGTTFKNNTDITSFNSFKYFTRANTNPSNSMFEGCSNLSQVDLSEILTVSNYEFKGTSIISINAPNLQSSGLNSFSSNNSLTTIVSLGHLLSIANSMFHWCSNIQTVNLPDECVEIQYRGFCPGGNSTDGILQTINGINHVKVFGGECFYRQKQLQLSASDLVAAEQIADSAFWYVPISSINSPNLISIGYRSFSENSRLTTIECLGKVSNISQSCFQQCTGLQTAKLPYECTELKNQAFHGDTLLSSVTQYNKSLTDYAEGETPVFTNLSRITNFGENCFYNCTSLLWSANDLSGAVSIGKEAFHNCKAVTINNLNLMNVSTIGHHAFNECKIDSVVWSSSMTTVPSGVFQSCELKHISNLDHVQIFGGCCIKGCTLQQVLYLKNVATTLYYGTNINSGDNGTTFTGDNKSGSAYALYMPKTRDIYGGYWSNNTYSSGFFGSRGTTTIPVVYFKDLEEIYPASFASLTCTSLIINNTTPPTWYNSLKQTDEEVADKGGQQKKQAFPGDCHITYVYVPDSALTTYTSDADWSTLTAKGVTFKSMNELTHYLTEADWITAGRPADGIIDAYMSY